MEDLASIWPQGGLFAFSGVDGDTLHAEPFVASGTCDGIGWEFWLTPRLAFRLAANGKPVQQVKKSDGFCFGDCWRMHVTGKSATGSIEGAFLDRSSLVIQALFSKAVVEIRPSVQGHPHGEASVFTGEGWWLALCETPPESRRVFSIAISYVDAEDAVNRAQAALNADVNSVITRRAAFVSGVKPPEAAWGEARQAYYKAVSVMKVNMESAQSDIPCRWTTPDRMPHRHMWLWDSAFHSLGLQYLRADLAEDAIRAVFAKQRSDGKLLLAAQPGVPAREEEDTQPPILAWAVWRQYECTDNRQFVRACYPSLVTYIEWFERSRRNDTGLYGWSIRTQDDPVRGARGGESGMDNSPRFDSVESMTAVDLSSYMAGEYRFLEKMARLLDKESEAVEWNRRRCRIAALANQLFWDDEDRFYYDLDPLGHFVPVKTTAGLTPLHARIPDRDQAEALRAHITNLTEFWAMLPVSSVSQDEEQFSNDMWRGPSWINMNLLLFYGLETYGFTEEAHALAHASVSEIVRWYLATGCLYEYYDALCETAPRDLPRKGAPGTQGGVGFGVVADLNWTAAAYIHFCHQIG